MPRSDHPERSTIQLQLARILASGPFQNSGRYPRLLRYVVEAALDGRAESLKERTLGIEVFRRANDYDATVDNIVRITAGEIRRRLSQYYDQPEHRNEPRIILPLGTYVPRFALAGASGSPEQTPSVPPDSLDEYWAPIISSPGPLLIVIGSPSEEVPKRPASWNGDTRRATLADIHRMPVHHVALPDAATMMKIAASVQARGKDYRVRNEAIADFPDLREGPAVLIGAFNNPWTRKLGAQRRFVFEGARGTDTSRIRDRRHPKKSGWSVDMSKPHEQVKADYGIVARFFSTDTGQPVVIAAGIGMYGTLAAGEFLTKREYMDELRSHAPDHRFTNSVEAVIATSVTNGVSGPPRIAATDFA